MGTDTFPTTIFEFAAYLYGAYAWLTDNATRLGVLPADMEALTALYGDDTTPKTYVYCKKVYDEAPPRKDSDVTDNLANVTEQIKVKLRKIYNDIPASKWTDEDRNHLNRKTGLPFDPTTPTETIKEVCVVDIEVRPNGLFYFGIRNRDEAKSSGLPDDADAIDIRWAIVESEYRKIDDNTPEQVLAKCESVNNCNNKELFTKAKFQINVDPTLKAFDLVCWARYTNSHHQNLAGEWSGPYTKMIL